MATASIGFIAPTVEVAHRAENVARELGMADKVVFRVGNHFEGLSTAKRLVEEGIEVLISRRSTAALIESELHTPNVSIPISLQDMAQALHQVQELTGLAKPRVGLFIMPSDQVNIESFAHYLNFDLRIYPVTEDEEYLSLMVDRAIAEQMDVIIAGTIVTVFANKRRFPCVLMDSGPVALRTALQEAAQVAYARKLEKTYAENFRIVVDTLYNGVLVTDVGGGIQIANPAAHDILGVPSIERGMPVHGVLPELDLTHCLGQGESLRSLFLHTARGPLVLDATPSLVGQVVRGAVITFQPAERVTELGAATRKNLHSEGFVTRYDFSSIVGESPQIARAKHIADGYAASSGAVLIAGETGTGKELFAQAIHKAGARRQGPFIPLNCAALPSSLLESELFGYEEGAFTGAMRKGKPGVFELAHQGTLFLDEISELNKHAQLRLLRVLQEHSVMRLGGSKMIPVDIRIITATNRNLWQMVEQGRFRKDLYYRLNVLPLFIPALRDREGDVAVLARHFLHSGSGGRIPELRQRDIRQLEAYPWPGNVRELQNVMERYALSAGEGVDVEALLAPQMEWASLDGTSSGPSLSTEQREEREQIRDALRRCGGRRGEAAKLLGINRTTLFRKMGRYAIE